MFITCQGSAPACLFGLNAGEMVSLTCAEDKLSIKGWRQDGCGGGVAQTAKAKRLMKAPNQSSLFHINMEESYFARGADLVWQLVLFSQTSFRMPTELCFIQ